MASDTERLAQLHRDGFISDRELYLSRDQFTVLEKGSSDAAYLLAPADTLIPAHQIARLGLEIAGGKIVQRKEGAQGGPEGGPSPQSASEPPSKPVLEAKPTAPTLSTFEAKKDVAPAPVSGPELDPRSGLPKSDPRFQPNSGSAPPKEEARAVSPKAEEKALAEQKKAQEAEAERARKAADAAKAVPARRARRQ